MCVCVFAGACERVRVGVCAHARRMGGTWAGARIARLGVWVGGWVCGCVGVCVCAHTLILRKGFLEIHTAGALRLTDKTQANEYACL